jgi:hypothetical protein
MAPGRAALAAGCVSLVAYGAGAWAVAPQHPQGDEPHYLIITQSLLEDHDLQIENNHKNGDYRAYFTAFPLKPDFLARGVNRQIYSVHAPGLPALVAPVFALFGYRGVVVALVCMAALASGLAWLVAWLATQNAAAAWFGWAAVSLSVPVFFHAGAVFPDGPAALLVLVGMLPLVDARWRSWRRLMVVGTALAALPWLHTRFAFLALPVALVIAGRILSDRAPRLARLAALAAVPAVSAIGWFLFFQIIYGTPNPSVVYGGARNTQFANMARGIPGLLFDQQFGLLAVAPVYLCAFIGLVTMFLRGRRRLAAELLLVLVPYVLVVASFMMWWAGTTAPARFLVPIALVLVVPMAVWFAGASWPGRVAAVAALVVSLLATTVVASVGRGAFVFNFRDGMSRVAMWLTPVVDLTRALPSLFQNPPATVLAQTAIWLTAIAAAVAVGALANRLGRQATVLAFGLAIELTTMVAVSLVWRSNHVTAVTPGASGPAVLRTLAPRTRQLALAYRPFGRMSLAALPERVVLARMLPATPAVGEWTGMVHLPAGIYEVRATIVGRGHGGLRVSTDRRSPPIADWTIKSDASEWHETLTIPVAVSALHVDIDGSLHESLRDVSVRAISLLPERTTGEARSAARYGPDVLYLTDGTAWLESTGAWVGGYSHALFLVAADDPGAVHLFVRNGPVANRVRLATRGWSQDLDLTPGGERLIDVPTDPRRAGASLEVRSSAGFRPINVDPKSQDDRLLGVWIATR